MDRITQEKIRNVAIIAHVDHGKTTLVDSILRQSNIFRSNQEEMTQDRILDSGELEREKGITIKAKNIAINYKGHKINIIDTPGHADFGGEVERTLNMADGCLLLVDAQEGPMPQTKFVLQKAFELGLKPIVVINKIDKKFATPEKTLDKIQDLFLTIAKNDEQLDFPVFYAIARDGKIFRELPTNYATTEATLEPLMEEIINIFPSPKGNIEDPFQMQISSLEFDPHLGRLLIGRIKRGVIKTNDSAVVLENDEEGSKQIQGSIKHIFVRDGLGYEKIDKAITGDIVAIGGLDSKAIGGTLASPQKPEALPVIKITPPSVRIKFEANTSPFVGHDGEFVTAKQLQQRLEKEAENNISLKITKADEGSGYYVAGRGELQLSILIETMRREGYEFQIKKPEVIFIKEEGVIKEPLEELIIEVSEEYQGIISATLSERRAEMLNMEIDNIGNSGQIKYTYRILTRNLLGLRNALLSPTKGNVVINSYLVGYVEVQDVPELFRKGVLISSDTGTSMGYSLNTIQERGELFIGPSEQVYEGMIIGINKFENDMEVNPTKGRQKSAVRMKHDEITQTTLKPTIPVTLEFALSFLGKEEILEVTPKNLRFRKQYLTKNQRAWAKRDNLTDYAKKHLNG